MDYSQCPIHNPRVGNDPDVDKFFSNIGIEPEYKLIVFLTVCIVVRLVMACLATVYADNKYLPIAAAVGAIIAILTMVSSLNGPQWWSRKFHLVIAILVLMASASQIYTGDHDRSIGYLLYADVIFGIATFGYVYLACPKY